LQSGFDIKSTANRISEPEVARMSSMSTRFSENTLELKKNNGTVFEELEMSIVDLTVANAVLLATRTVIPILMKFSQRVHTSLKTYK
jgi:hypothetical protein